MASSTLAFMLAGNFASMPFMRSSAVTLVWPCWRACSSAAFLSSLFTRPRSMPGTGAWLMACSSAASAAWSQVRDAASSFFFSPNTYSLYDEGHEGATTYGHDWDGYP